MKPVLVDQLRHLFKDEESHKAFIDILAGHAAASMTPIVHQGETLGVLLSPEMTKQVLASNLLKKFQDDPDLFFDTIVDRLSAKLDEPENPPESCS